MKDPWGELIKLKKKSVIVYWGYIPLFVILILIIDQVFSSEFVGPLFFVCFILYFVFMSLITNKINSFTCPQCGLLFYQGGIMFNSARVNCSHCGIKINDVVSREYQITNPRPQYSGSSFIKIRMFGAISLIFGIGNCLFALMNLFQPEASVTLNGISYTDLEAKINYMLLSLMPLFVGLFLFYFKSIVIRLENLIYKRQHKGN